jgi:TonB-linked SusC/RagA family outer membrane protein
MSYQLSANFLILNHLNMKCMKLYKIKFKGAFPLMLFLLISFLGKAQKTTIKGTVTDGKEPVVGASVYEKGTSNGTLTDLDGKYEIKADKNGILIFSFLNTPTEEPINGRSLIDIDLNVQDKILNEVVVVGYGTQRKSDLTGAVSGVKGKDLTSIATPSVLQALQGKVAGVLVTPTSGSPGAGAVIRIRGTGTLNNSNPFYVLDGMLLDNIDFLNSNDIESIEVLKDASATAIYGSRGANGVIIVTTKKGTAKKSTIGLSAYYGTQELGKKIALTNATEYAKLRNIAAKNFGQPEPYKNPESLGVGTDWQNEIFRTAPIQNINLSARGGSEKMTYSISGDYMKQDGILKNGDFQRLSLRINNDYKLNNFIKIGHNLSIIDERSNYAAGTLYNAYYAPPTVAPIDSLGKFGNTTSDGSVANPTAQIFYERYNSGNTFRTVGNMYLDITPLKGLTFRSNVGLELSNSESKRFLPVFKVTDIHKNEVNFVEARRSKTQNRLWENTLTYDKTYGKHRFSLLAGITAQTYDDDFISGRATDLPNDVNNIEADIESLLYLRAGTKGFSVIDDAGHWRLYSNLFRLNYVFNEKYLLTASMRRDGSSKFGKNRRFGTFPSVAVGWRLKEEAFLKDVSWLSNLKLRGSWGVIGNEKINEDAKSPPVTDRLDAVFGQDEKFFPGASITRLSNPDLHWEETRQSDIGLEIGLLDNRLSAEIDWYNRNTYDILAELPIPAFIGAAAPPIVNAAKVQNTGFDINLRWQDRVKKDFGYNIGFILSTVHNEVLGLGEGKTEIFSGGVGEGGKLGTRTVVGLPIGAYYGYKVAGVYQNAEQVKTLPKRSNETPLKDVLPGDLIYADLDGDGVITTKDRTYLGNAIPNLILSCNIGADFMGFDFSIQINSVQGNTVLNAKRLARFSTGNFESTFLNGWTAEGTSNFEPRVTIGGRNYEVSDRFLEDGSFTSIRNAQIGYTLPLSIARKMKVQSLRIYAAATNLKMWTNYSGYTPEIVNDSLDVFSVGIDRGVYPVAKTINFGINATF